ncbi:adenylosuccinate lyase [Candidatus Methylacidithermus pantelleriae]|uniref:Adenylosuccinate lyase n=1 Tax=Candidatus Methylacidithermus pantelleriae TaxID=2744239 RepID=A0A8J2BQB0_9BACT|nr:adenylosuccinate lyase [Candidatus Methylacidithermus pantelleriae]CAF0698797.1 Adenylosuccinate lyase [Candidatus Methylacidithermus pantelleriae]
MIERYSREPMRSLWTEQARLERWWQVELCVAQVLAEQGVIPQEDVQEIASRARYTLEEIEQRERETRHDVLAFVEVVARSVGPAGRWIHYGVTSSDIVDTALALQLRDSLEILLRDVREIREVVGFQARTYAWTPMIGRTHGVHAEPITLGVKWALCYDEFGRAERRLQWAKEEVSVGKISGAVGTYVHIDPEVEKKVCERLGLRYGASSQVVPRDRHALCMSVLATVASTVERWAMELRHLHRTEVKEVLESFAPGQKGSSAMPHKQNPVRLERLCGLARLLRGYAVAAWENVPLWHERDISHSSVERIIFPDGMILLDFMLGEFASLARTVRVDPQRMKENLERSQGRYASEALLLELVQRGLSRKEAYEIVQRVAFTSDSSGQPFWLAASQDPVMSKWLSEAQLQKLGSLEGYLRHVPAVFQRAGLELEGENCS